MKCNIDKLYSDESVEQWKQIIGEELHYHNGYFIGQEDLSTGLRQTVRNFYPYISPGSKVLDAGCGWGGPARMLIEEHNCLVQGITISKLQAEYCQSIGLNVWQQDLEKDEIPGEYDVILSLEVLSHIYDKAMLLHRFRQNAPRLILSVNCVSDNFLGERTTFNDSMILCSTSELVRYLTNEGWRIQSLKNRRFYSIPTIKYWRENLERVYGNHTPPGQFNLLRNLTDAAFKSIGAWCQAFPLIDIIADRV
ncbi:MAG: class I SAM-dependent methyltransferase [Nostoc sp.]|uniref:class I SAM-dependent methyltransferase n=1 Tax=Nostoc sp. TaxID=1180 RepID=UPI002FF62558